MARTFWLLSALMVCSCTQSVRVEDVTITPVTAADIHRVVRDSGAKAVLVNMWATWCGPCREEFPDLVRIARQYKDRGLTIMLVSADDEAELTAVKRFLAEQGVDFPAYIKAEKDQPFIDALEKRWSGALPATFLYDGSGKLRDFWEGKTTFSVLEQKVVEAFKPQTQPTGGNP